MNNLLNKCLLFVSIILVLPSAIYAQHRSCGTNWYMKAQMDKHPEIRESRGVFENSIPNPSNTVVPTQGLITIPTVVHIVYKDGTENVSDDQIYSQLRVLNEDFRRKNADAIHTPAIFQSVAADMEIEFCLATIDPNGATTTGITRTITEEPSFNFNDRIKMEATGGIDPWDTKYYLNIWIGDLGTLLGYATFPGGDPLVDGVVIDYRAFGTVGTATAPFHLGRTATHEIGHWLNLHHVWGDGGCGLDDGVSDTPLAGFASDEGAPCSFPSKNTCDEGVGDLPDMFQNFMDYSYDECMNLFTDGQKARMRSLFMGSNFRASLLNAQGCSSPLVASTCTDGIQNGNEEGIDCGGDCLACNWIVTSNTCTDGIQNGNEEGIDCGGDCPACNWIITSNTCIDGIQNGNEEGIDCGGDCPACNRSITSNTCTDGIQNGNEEGIDCGGDCPACNWIITSNTCTDGIQNGNEEGIDCGGDCPVCREEIRVPTFTQWGKMIFALLVLNLSLLLVFQLQKLELES